MKDTNKSVVPDPGKDIWDELDRLAKEAYWRALERQVDFIQFLSERISDWQNRTRALAYSMWEEGGRQPGRALDHWIAAETDVWGPMRERIQHLAYSLWDAAGRQPGRAFDDWLEAQKTLLAPIWDQTRTLAQTIWEATGQEPGKAIEHWVAAEKEILRRLQLEAGNGDKQSQHSATKRHK